MREKTEQQKKGKHNEPRRTDNTLVSLTTEKA